MDVSDADTHVVQHGLGHADREGERDQRMGDGQRIESSMAPKHFAQNQTTDECHRDQHGIGDVRAREYERRCNHRAVAAAQQMLQVQEEEGLREKLLRERPDQAERDIHAGHQCPGRWAQGMPPPCSEQDDPGDGGPDRRDPPSAPDRRRIEPQIRPWVSLGERPDDGERNGENDEEALHRAGRPERAFERAVDEHNLPPQASAIEPAEISGGGLAHETPRAASRSKEPRDPHRVDQGVAGG